MSELATDTIQQQRVIAVDDDDGLLKVRPAQPNYIRIHVYLGTLCRSEMFDKSKDF